MLKKFLVLKKKIFNTGYLYLEQLQKNKNEKFNQNKILFAPSWNNSTKNLFDDHAEKIIDKLLEKNFKTILRTHPETTRRSNKNLKKIMKKYSTNDNFEINTNLRNLKALNESSILITDNGGIALEYIIIQRKPVLYVDYSEKIHNEFFDKFKIETFEDRVKKDIGTTISVNELNKIDYFLVQTKVNFIKNLDKIDKLLSEFGIVTKNQTQNKKDVILKLLSVN